MTNFFAFLSSIVTVSAFAIAQAAAAENTDFNNLERVPDTVAVTTETGTISLARGPGNLWTVPDSPGESASRGAQSASQNTREQFPRTSDVKSNIHVSTTLRPAGIEVVLSAPGIAVKSVQISWRGNLPSDGLYLGDAWERAYGDLEWKALDPKRVMPWYFLVTYQARTDGFGVKTDPSALCYWTTETNAITLHADVRCGGMGVQLGKRKLPVCTVICRQGLAGETTFAADRAFCRQMCSHPRLPREPVYGFNDWYCTYGRDTASKFLANVDFLTGLSAENKNRPFAVMDDGWQWKGENGDDLGLWNQVNPAFSRTLTMREIADAIRRRGARPGLWYRPLVANADAPQSWRLQRDPAFLDPTVPQVRALIRQTVKRFRGWGYELIKHDFTTDDICGRWGMEMHDSVTADGWAFADRSKTTAEAIRDLYQDIRSAAGNGIIIDGCNTIGHLSAGLFEMQRVGDDNSGNNWARTRKMGINCLAFRGPQQGAFFAIDADCVGQTSPGSVSWEKTSQWLDLLAHSGTPLFISIPCDTVNPARISELREALSAAARPQPLAEPLDWMKTRIPEHWLLDGQKTSFSW